MIVLTCWYRYGFRIGNHRLKVRQCQININNVRWCALCDDIIPNVDSIAGKNHWSSFPMTLEYIEIPHYHVEELDPCVCEFLAASLKSCRS